MPDDDNPSPLSDEHMLELVTRRVAERLKAESREAEAERVDWFRWLIGTVLLGGVTVLIGLASVGFSLMTVFQDLQRVRRDVEPAASLVDFVELANRLSGSTKAEYEETSESSGANSQLDREGAAEHLVGLEAGFLPDPRELILDAGGDVDAFDVDGQGDCVGYVDQTPDVQLEWSDETEELRIFFTADNAVDDATLLVWTGEEWFCSDDSSSLNPLVVLKGIQEEASYRIWVGSFDGGRSIPGRLSITELDLEPASWFDELAGGR